MLRGRYLGVKVVGNSAEECVVDCLERKKEGLERAMGQRHHVADVCEEICFET